LKFSRGGITFPIFREIVQYYFPKIPDYETSMLFRDSWCVGQQKVTIESFFTVICEKGYLIRLMDLPIINKFPLYDAKQDKILVHDKRNKHNIAC